MEKKEKYYLGLDIGTTSVGFCVTDENYNVINKKGRDLWGVELFDEAKTAQDRRLKRGSRRSVQRQKERLMLLKSLFEDEINKVDPNFFNRLKVSALWEDDKQSAGIFSRNSLFFDENLDDKKFYKKYPTIYHLRQACLVRPAEDIRYLYLVIHNMLKHRGNFLLDNFSLDDSEHSNLVVLFENLQNEIISDDECGDYEYLSLSTTLSLSKEQKDKLTVLEEELSVNRFNTTTLIQKFKDIFVGANQNQIALLRAISGGTVSVKTIFSNNSNEVDCDAKIDNFGVEDEVFEQFVSDIGTIGDKAQAIILSARQIYNKIVFKKILGKNTYFCDALVERFEQHKKQLDYFKKQVMKPFYHDQYNQMFKVVDSKVCNYAKYIQGSNYFSCEKKPSSKCSKQDFYKYVKSVLQSNKQACERPEVKIILDAIEQDNFLPKLRTSVNSVIPYQLNKFELEKILEQAEKKYSFLSKRDQDGLSVSDKIIAILEYKIPYFVGPLSTKNSKNAWIVKRLNEKILPWNIEKVVDYDKCEQEFIKRMQNNCSYLYSEPVLPKCSLLYTEYMVLQQLNNLCINGKKLSKDLKEQILDLFKKNGTLKISTLKSFLKQNGCVQSEEQINISGINDKFDANMNIYKNFNNILGGEIEKYKEQVEDIIVHATYVSDKFRLQKWLKKTYSSILSDAQIKNIKGLKIADWGKFSRKFLDGILGIDEQTGEARTIIQIMRDEPLNLMEVLAKYRFGALEVSHQNKDYITYDDVKGLYCSPAVRRGIWQSVNIVNELQKVMGNKPEKIFIEVARSSDPKAKGKETIARKNKMQLLYKKIKDEVEFNCDIDLLKEELSQTQSLDSKKVYLYFTQMGKCMYTGETIDLELLLTNNEYDIDHVFPQSVIKDDSFDNLVLVKRKENIDKSNNVVSPEIQTKMRSFWEYLKKNDLISNEKLSRLLRTDELTELEKKDFVKRQLVITNQTAKAVIDLFKSVYGTQNVIFSKANYVSAFRNCEYKFASGDKEQEIDRAIKTPLFRQSLIKCRDMNDLHHAKDAYLNIFVGNIFNEKFSKRFYLREYDNFPYGFNLNNAFVKDIVGVYEKDKHLTIVQQTMESNTPTVTFLSREKHGAFYKETIFGVTEHQKDIKNIDAIKMNKASKWDGGKISRKSSNNPLSQIEKYGSLKDANYSYMVLIEYEEKHKRIRRLVSMPWLFSCNIKNDDDLKATIQMLTGQRNFDIIIKKINFGTIIKIGSGYFKIAGNTNDKLKLHNFNQLYLPTNVNEYFKMVSKLYKKAEQDLRQDGENILFAQNRFGEKKIITKQENLELYKLLVKHLNKAIYKDVSIGDIGKKLKNTYDTFMTLNCYQQIQTIKGIIDIVNGVNGGNLTNVGEKKSCGVLTINKTLSNKSISLMYQSPTGYYKKELKIS